MDFQTRFAKLNNRQKKAVEKINGPLLVLAGPGTGKTELLSMRAAQILRQTDTLASNILCLTFTDSAAANMRQRLRQIIGEDAYKVAIHTFHSFGTEVINQHRQYFFDGADTKPADELTQHQILRQIFEELDWKNPLSSRNGDDFVYLPDTLRVISEFKQSGLSPDELRQIFDDNQRIFSEVSDDITKIFVDKISKNTIVKLAPLATKTAKLTAKKLPPNITPYANVLALSLAHVVEQATEQNSTKPITAWKNSWCEKDQQGKFVLKDARAIEKLYAVVDIYQKYLAALADKKIFDYDDMIISVLRACENNADLAANLREQYQYIMVDEFQDTNLAQLRLLFCLTGDEESPNIMAVGDDDQAIYSFQGADIGNIQRFRQHYHDPTVIVLTDNYRSATKILEASRAVITQGLDRLENSIKGLSKELTAHADEADSKVSVHQFNSPLDERAGVAEQISRLIASGVQPADIAVLARQHTELIEFLPYLSSQNIAVNYERREDVLDQEIIKTLELISRLILSLANSDLDTTNALLPEIVAHPAFEFLPLDIWKISLSSYKNRQLWLETMLANSTFAPFANWLLQLAKNSHTQPLELQIDEILGLSRGTDGCENELDDTKNLFVSPVSAHYFDPSALQNQPELYLSTLESLRTLRDKLRDHYIDQEPTLSSLIDFIDLNRSLKNRLTAVRHRTDQQTKAINLMSAHKAKGLEFPHVFVIGAIDSTWGEKARSRSRLIRYPANLPLAPAGATYDERLRLFFVAMTRAKSTLNISFSTSDKVGKSSLIASFLSDRTPDMVSTTPDIASMTKTEQIDWHSRLSKPITADLRSCLAPTLENYKLSATHLNNFLDVSRGGPQYFLLNNLLRFPQAKSAAASYGTAIHATLQYCHNQFKINGHLPERSEILDSFSRLLREKHLSSEDFTNYNSQGREALDAFFDAKQIEFLASQVTELSFSNQGATVGEARLTGALDLVDIDKKAKTISVTDYKTGRATDSWRGHSDYEKIKLHKYRQQLMFYQLLIENSRDYSSYSLTGARLQFVEPDRRSGQILALEDSFSAEDLTRFRQLISIVWQKITTLELPDVTDYEPNYKGMLQFEEDLLTKNIDNTINL